MEIKRQYLQEEIIENKELGISYRDTDIWLPYHRQVETGIKRIRRRELLKIPNDIYINIDKKHKGFHRFNKERILYSTDPKFDQFYLSITDGLYPTEHRATHTVSWDVATYTQRATGLNIFLRDQCYFQKIMPKFIPAYSFPTFFKKDGNTLYIDDPFEKELKDIPINYPRSEIIKVYSNHLIENENNPYKVFSLNLYRYRCPNFETPVFIFGSLNNALKNYSKSILNNDEILWMLSQSGFYYDFNISKRIDDEEEKKLNLRSTNYFGYENLTCLENLAFGNLTSVRDITSVGEIHIPSVEHPDIKPLRWCHADVALIPTKKNLNVLFFENE